MITNISDPNSRGLFQTYNQDGNNIFLNSEVEVIMESPEGLGNALADIWLCLAYKHQNNQLNANEIRVLKDNINAAISYIEQMGYNQKNVHQSFTSKIASFSVDEQQFLIEFFKETISSDLINGFSGVPKPHFFSLFMKVFNTLNISKDNSQDQLIVDQIVKELEEHSYNERLLIGGSQIPQVLQECLFKDYKRVTEISKFFKANEIWEKIKNHCKDINFDVFKENSETNGFASKFAGIEVNNNILNNDKDLVNSVKEKILEYINLNTSFPLWYDYFWDLPFDNGISEIMLMMNWLGRDRFEKIQKIKVLVNETDTLPFEDIHYICPNLEELDLILYSVENDSEIVNIFENISKFPKLKKINISGFKTPRMVIFCLNKILTMPEKLDWELDLGMNIAFNFYEQGHFKLSIKSGNLFLDDKELSFSHFLIYLHIEQSKLDALERIHKTNETLWTENFNARRQLQSSSREIESLQKEVSIYNSQKQDHERNTGLILSAMVPVLLGACFVGVYHRIQQVYSQIKPEVVQPVSPPLADSSPFGKISLVAGAFFAVATCFGAYYYRKHNQKNRENSSTVKPPTIRLDGGVKRLMVAN